MSDEEENGPYVSLAVLVQTVLQEGDGALSLIRVIDQLTNTFTGPEPPQEMPAFAIEATIVLGLKSGNVVGNRNLRVALIGPSGQLIGTTMTLPVHFDGIEHGFNVTFMPTFLAPEAGVYWFDVILGENRLLTRIPLRVVYERVVSEASLPTGSRPKESFALENPE
ncbi:MAG: hypothetical protein NVSMB52_20270 [Chloroflexota bacterium]